MSRAKNDASARDILKVLKANGLQHLPKAETYAHLNVEDMIEKNKELVMDILKESQRPTCKVLQAGCVLHFPGCTKDMCKGWCDKLVHCISYCRSKRSASSGKKLPPAVFDIVNFLKSGKRATVSITASGSTARSSPAQLPLQDSQQSSEKSPEGKADIYRQYGLQPPMSPAPESEAIVVSSQEDNSCVQPPAKEAPPKQEGAQLACREYFDSGRLCMVKAYADGTLVQASMSAGPHGFMRAQFPDEVGARDTEIPNLRAATAAMKKPASSAKKRPAAADPSDSEPAAASQRLAVGKQSEAQAPMLVDSEEGQAEAMTYSMMFYAKTNRMAIRERRGEKRQIFQFGTDGVSREKLAEIAGACIKRLESGSLAPSDGRGFCESNLPV